ncbi:MAG: indolepyruvate ferredoxin oxidoreductase subunit alpha [Victivallales bacterium]|nr:indolepyruvate ferredoxin oxidoreductase subunit alpha [Victivallales bacterium]
MSKLLLSGNEALARGAWEAGVGCAFGYPGTPSTEILEALVKLPGPYCEWSPNEKVALEAAAGAAIAGTRTIVTMKLVGLNVAADPMMTLSYIGVVAGLVIVVADDPGQHSSQTEQDTRHYARLAKIPVLEPGDARDCASFMKAAFEMSEKYRCPVILRTTTCVSHSRFLVEVGERVERARIPFEKKPSQFVPLPMWGRKLRADIEERMVAQSQEGDTSPLNTQYLRGHDLGIISHGVTALHCLDVFPDASVLKIGLGWPFPDGLLQKFASQVKRVLVVEEGDPILEEHVRSLGIACDGKGLVPRCGELTPAVLAGVKAHLEGREPALPQPVPEAADLPGRPPMLCPGCPHRGTFYALAQFDVIVTGDIGCYTLGVFPPLSRTDTCLCMGGGFTMAHGMNKAGETRPVVGIVGDSTFYHSGITGLLNLVYNKGNATLIVVDNRTTAMTGHQDHPGTGKTLMGEPTVAASIEQIAKACGMQRVRVVNPLDFTAMKEALQEELYCGEPSLIIARAPCILKERKAARPALKINPDACKNCRACLKLGCPAIESPNKQTKPSISPQTCTGCTLCQQVCKFHAIP